ncbi:recombinase family protein [Saccharopolyspora sp. ASAGF58]|nr:recombinase family protein [Saccharopolyspora sp. ASAGF58]
MFAPAAHTLNLEFAVFTEKFPGWNSGWHVSRPATTIYFAPGRSFGSPGPKPGHLAPVPEPDDIGTDGPIRIGYARCSSATQELQSQLDALARAQCTRVFSEKISTQIKIRPEFEKVLALAHEIKQAAPRQQVVLTVHEMKRLARNAAKLMTLSAKLLAGGIGLEMLTGPLTGIYDPRGAGSILFAVLAVGTELDRNYIREEALEGQQAAAAKGNHGGRPKVVDDDSLTFALALKAKGVPVGEIAKKLTTKTGKNAGKSPSVASLYRALAEAEETAADDNLPTRPKPARIRRPGEPLTPEETDLRQRIENQVLQTPETE